VNLLRSIPCDLQFLNIEPLIQSVANIDLSGIGWVAVGGMSGPLHKKHRMDPAWAAENDAGARRTTVEYR
jgi:protein gp37